MYICIQVIEDVPSFSARMHVMHMRIPDKLLTYIYINENSFFIVNVRIAESTPRGIFTLNNT